MRLFHFSDNSEITTFEPRPIRVQVDRPAGQEWLNGPLVWAIDGAHEHLYLFPRECPRIVVWRTTTTTSSDMEQWFRGSACRAIAFVERAWLDRIEAGAIYRYDLPTAGFEDVGEVGMWVSRLPVRPIGVEALSPLQTELIRRDVELRVVDTLVPLKGVWETSLHASGIRLRNAQGWGKPAWTHSKPGRPVRL